MGNVVFVTRQLFTGYHYPASQLFVGFVVETGLNFLQTPKAPVNDRGGSLRESPAILANETSATHLVKSHAGEEGRPGCHRWTLIEFP